VSAAIVLVAVLAVGGAWLLWPARDGASAPPTAPHYFCPMHPTMVSDRPGDCPICHMRMVPFGSAEGEAEAARAHDGETVPGSVHVPAAKRQLIGVKTAPVARERFERSIRAVGRVAFDETRERHVTIKTAGYVERLYANATGRIVRAGEPLLELYSPELLASQQEYLVALAARSRVAGSRIPSLAGTGEALVASARRRLALLDVPEEHIRRLESGGEPTRSVLLRAPISCTLTHRAVAEGDRVEAGARLLDVVDLSAVWVLASVHEHELPFVAEGQVATMTLSYLPGRSFAGRVALIYPQLDPATRSAPVRLEFPNPDLELRPEMYAEVVLVADLGERLAVPDGAVVDTGTRRVVFVDRGEGRLEPREIRVGLRLPERWEVLEGLAEGETIVTSGTFLIDSESRLAAALGSMADAPAPAGHEH
jgi:Cu(I)/Ag(I) efflux system membrane fusion protein